MSSVWESWGASINESIGKLERVWDLVYDSWGVPIREEERI